MLTLEMLQEFNEYLQNGEFLRDLELSSPERKAQILDMIDLIFQICEKADEIITQHFYGKLGVKVSKNSF